MNNPFTARWTASGNNLCLGQWEICYCGLPLALESAIAERDMGTFGNFSYIYPDDDEFIEGLPEDDWILENIGWISDLFAAQDIPIDEAHMRWLYRAINPHDWRCGSCGGCL